MNLLISTLLALGLLTLPVNSASGNFLKLEERLGAKIHGSMMSSEGENDFVLCAQGGYLFDLPAGMMAGPVLGLDMRGNEKIWQYGVTILTPRVKFTRFYATVGFGDSEDRGGTFQDYGIQIKLPDKIPVFGGLNVVAGQSRTSNDLSEDNEVNYIGIRAGNGRIE